MSRRTMTSRELKTVLSTMKHNKDNISTFYTWTSSSEDDGDSDYPKRRNTVPRLSAAQSIVALKRRREMEALARKKRRHQSRSLSSSENEDCFDISRMPFSCRAFSKRAHQRRRAGLPFSTASQKYVDSSIQVGSSVPRQSRKERQRHSLENGDSTTTGYETPSEGGVCIDPLSIEPDDVHVLFDSDDDASSTNAERMCPETGEDATIQPPKDWPPRKSACIEDAQASTSSHSRPQNDDESQQKVPKRKRDYFELPATKIGRWTNNDKSNGLGTLSSVKTFYVDSTHPYLSLVEGVAAMAKVETLNGGTAYINNVVLGQQSAPLSGRMMELPNEALVGRWTAKVVHQPGSTSSASSFMSPDHLEHFRVQLRHESYSASGCLSRTRPSDPSHRHVLTGNNTVASSAVKEVIEPIENGCADDLKSQFSSCQQDLDICALHPELGRVHSMKYQGIVDLDKHPDSFIGSLSFVCFDGFWSTNDSNERAKELSSHLLNPRAAFDLGLTPLSLSSPPRPPCESLLLYELIHDKNPATNHGVSVLCCRPMNFEYHVLVGQDPNSPKDNIVALDGTFRHVVVLQLPFVSQLFIILCCVLGLVWFQSFLHPHAKHKQSGRPCTRKWDPLTSRKDAYTLTARFPVLYDSIRLNDYGEMVWPNVLNLWLSMEPEIRLCAK
jgi:hypothetical protein